MLRKRWEVFSVFCQNNRLFCLTLVTSSIAVNVSPLARNLNRSPASAGQVLRYSAYSRDCEGVFFRSSALESILSMDLILIRILQTCFSHFSVMLNVLVTAEVI